MTLVSERIDAFISSSTSPSLHFAIMRDRVDLDTDAPVELKRLNSHFSKLKLGYLHLITKRSLLTHLLTNTDPIPTSTILHRTRIQEMDQTINKGKKEMKDLQQQLIHVKQQIQKTIIDVIHQWEQYQSSRDSFISSYNPELTRTLQPNIPSLCQLNATSTIYGSIPTDMAASLFTMDSTDTCHTILKYQLKHIDTITSRTSEVEQRVIEMEKEIPQWEQKMEEIKKEIGVMTESASSLASVTAFVTLNTQSRWYEAATSTLSQLNGISVISCNGHTLIVALNIDGVQQHVHIKYDEEMSRFISITLPSSDMYVADIIEHAISTQSLSFLCRELHARCMTYPIRTQHLTSLRHITSISTSQPHIVMTLEDMGVIVTLNVGWDYPSTYSYIEILSMEPITTWDPMSLEFIQASINHAQITNVNDAIERIETELRQQKLK